MQLGRQATIYTADLASQESVSALLPAILKDGRRIDALLNCAGIQRRHPSHQFPIDDWNEVRLRDPISSSPVSDRLTVGRFYKSILHPSSRFVAMSALTCSRKHAMAPIEEAASSMLPPCCHSRAGSTFRHTRHRKVRLRSSRKLYRTNGPGWALPSTPSHRVTSLQT